MHCDDVFDLLTQSASPRHSDAGQRSALERHLEDCPDCRAVAAAIVPAAETLRAAQQLPLAVKETRRAVPRRPARADDPWRKTLAPLGLYLVAASVALVMLTLSVLDSRQRDFERRGGGAPFTAAEGSLAELAPQLASLGISEACRQAPANSNQAAAIALTAVAAKADLACCTSCHHAAGGVSSPVALASVSQSCQVCHN